MGKIYEGAEAALKGVLRDGLTIAVGGFGLCGIPEHGLEAVRQSGVKNLTIVSITGGTDDAGVGVLLQGHQVKKLIASYVGENNVLMDQFTKKELEIEFCPQGTLAERLRAGGFGIPAFYTKTGVGTIVAEGKETRTFDGRDYLMERGIFCDLALVKAWKADEEGNLVYRKAARNLNPVAAVAARLTVAEVEHLVPNGQLDPDLVHTPGLVVQRVFKGLNFKKPIERRTTRTA